MSRAGKKGCKFWGGKEHETGLQAKDSPFRKVYIHMYHLGTTPSNLLTGRPAGSLTILLLSEPQVEKKHGLPCWSSEPVLLEWKRKTRASEVQT